MRRTEHREEKAYLSEWQRKFMKAANEERELYAGNGLKTTSIQRRVVYVDINREPI